MQQLHNDIIDSPDYGGLLGARNADKNYVISSYTMFCYLAIPQLRPMKNHHKVMCGCAISNTSKYFQEWFNVWRRKQLKIIKYKTDNSSGSNKYELTQSYKSYTDYAFPNYETHHARCENAADLFLCTPTNDDCKYPNWECELWKCTACTPVALPGVKIGSSNRAPMITFNTYMTQFTCLHHGIIIRGKITTYLDEKGTYKKTCFLSEQ